jgi:Carboxypeptidase regulatory-like domain/PDZ domain
MQARPIQDASGAFTLDNLLPGKYVLTASAEGRPPAKTGVIEVESGRTTHHVHLVLAKGATLSGKVIDAESRRPLAGATVALDAMTSTAANLIAPSHTDDSGGYSLEGAPAGPFSIRVAHEGYRSKIVPGIVTRGAAATQDVALQPLGDGGAGGTELAGIGAVLVPDAQGVALSFIIPGGPADKAALRNGDVITRIDGLDAQSLTVSDCVQRLRGPEGSRVFVSVKRDGQSVDVTLTRELIVR